MGGGEGRLHKSKSGGSLRLLSLATIRHQLEGMSVAAGQSLRLSTSATTAQKPSKPRHHVLRVSGAGKDVLVMTGGIVGPSVVSTPKDAASTAGGQEGRKNSGRADIYSLFEENNKVRFGGEEASSSASAVPAAEQNGTLRGWSNLGRPPTPSSLTACGTNTACKPILLSNFQGELWLEKGSIAFVIRQEKSPPMLAAAPTAPAAAPATPTPVGPLAAVRIGMRRTLSRRSSSSNPSPPPLFPPPPLLPPRPKSKCPPWDFPPTSRPPPPPLRGVCPVCSSRGTRRNRTLSTSTPHTLTLLCSCHGRRRSLPESLLSGQRREQKQQEGG